MFRCQEQAKCSGVRSRLSVQVSGAGLSLVHNMMLVRASRRKRRERRERRFVNYPASVNVGERWLTLE